MKVTKTQGQPAFQPIELKITIESAEEHHVLQRVFWHEITVSRVLIDVGVITKDEGMILRKMLALLQKGF